MLEPRPKKYTDATTPTSEISNNQLTPLNGGTAATAIATPDANHNGPANWCTASHTSRDSRTSGTLIPTYLLPGKWRVHANAPTSSNTTARAARTHPRTTMDTTVPCRNHATNTPPAHRQHTAEVP